VALLSLRVALVLLLAGVVGIVSGTLALLASPKRSVPAAVLVGGSASGCALSLFNALVSG
jgi:hypothetical protein